MNERDLFIAALQIDDEAQRAAYLDEGCAGDPELRQRVEALIRAFGQAGSFLQQPAADPAATIDQPLPEKPGMQIGPYKLLQQIGEGGMGVVYMAEQTEPVQRRVALKIIKPGMDTHQVIARFEAERQALAMMDHPNIARVFDAGTTGGNPKSEARNPKQIQSPKSEVQKPGEPAVSGIGASDLDIVSDFGFRHSDFPPGRPYFVMELVKGVPITQYCDEHHLTPRERLELFVPVCQAVQHAHQKGIIHRDIKPSNVLVAEYDDRPVPKVIDFGVAKAIQQRLTEKSMFTQFGQVVGTIDYMSPEQAKLNQLDIDTRSDIYSLGVLLYELLSGETPFDRERLRSAAFDEMLRIIREEEPPRPSLRLSSSGSLPSIAANRQIEPKKLSTLVRGELDWIVMKALEKDRSRRYETANGFAQDIERYLSDEPVQACPPSAVYRFKKFARRNKVALSVAGLILFFLVLLGSGIGWSLRDRVARQARVSEQVELILEEVERFEREHKWPEALAAARRAEPALAGGEAPEDLQARVRQVVADLETVDRLEEIRFLRSEVKGHRFDWEGANRHYAAAFREYGVDVDALPPDEAATWLRSRAGVLPALIVALDEWARCRGTVKDEAGAKALTTLAQALDADPWRRRVREALTAKDEKALEELAGSAEVARQAPSTVAFVARALEKSGRAERALAVLGRALDEHPDDFWLHFDAAVANSSCHPPRADEEFWHFRVALALRPRSVAVLSHLGDALCDQEKFDAAIAWYRKAIELDPKCAFAHSNLGAALHRQKKFDEATASLRKAIELDPKFAMAHSGLGVALSDQGQLEEAIAWHRKAIELDPKYANAHNGLGAALWKQKKPDEAIACWRKAIELDPKFGLAHNNLGLALKDQGKLDEAIACWRKAVEVDPKLAMAHNNLGAALLQGKIDEAIACCRKAIELDPKEAFAHSNLGNALRAQGKREEAIAYYRKAIELDPKQGAAHNNLGVVLKEQGKLDEAITPLRKAIQLDPKLAMAHNNLGEALWKQKKLDEAVAACRKAIELDPKLAFAHNNLGLALKDQGKLDEAIACYHKAIELEPKCAPAHYNLGNALHDQGTLEEAIASYRKAIELDPKDAPAHGNLGNVLNDQGRREEAIAYYRKAIELDPKQGAAHNNLGVVLKEQGKLDEAITPLRKAIQLDPKYAGAHRNLGDVLAAQKKLDEAIGCWRKAIEIDPKDAGTHSNLAWHLATAEDVKLRNAEEAVELACKAIELEPKKANHWNNLGVAQCRAGDWQAAVDAFQKADALIGGRGDRAHRFFLAMAYWKLGSQAKAREAHTQALEWLNEKKRNEEQYRFRDEAGQLLGITTSPAAPKGDKPQPEKPKPEKSKPEQPKPRSGARE